MGLKDHSNRTRDVIAKLRADGWIEARKGPGDHVQFKHPGRPGRVTLDSGAREIPTGRCGRSTGKQVGNGEGGGRAGRRIGS
jgi:predicted RNA binding protein YcfA (HicA-like mRNA interferase family)